MHYEEVRIKDRPVAGHIAIVEELADCRLSELDQSAKSRLLVALFGCQTMVELPLAAIEKL
ncbi:MAG: hypothetical protein R3D62_04120 [Xanthobacteraceae bacterium]